LNFRYRLGYRNSIQLHHTKEGRAPMTRRLATICLMTMFLLPISPTLVAAQDSQYSNVTLKGIDSLSVTVEPLGEAAKTLGLTEETIKTDVELKLRLAGVQVVTKEEGAKLSGQPRLYVNITVPPLGNAACINVVLPQNALLERNGEFAFGIATWSAGVVTSSGSAQHIRDVTKDVVDRFLNAWLSVNPKK
jgi:hypothetical protein